MLYPFFSKKIAIGIGMIFVFSAIAFVFVISPHKFLSTARIYRFLEKPAIADLGVNLFQARSSIMKVANVLHFPYWFRESALPAYSLSITEDNLQILEDSLPKDRFYGKLLAENKQFVEAYFKADDYEGNVEVRYRGLHAAHWNNAKRSLLVKFPKEKLFNGIKSIDLIVPEERAYLGEQLDAYRVMQLGLPYRDSFFVRVRINNKDAGVYFAAERFSKEWLEISGLPTTSEIFSRTGEDKWGEWKKDINEDDPDYEALEAFLAFYKEDKEDKESVNGVNDIELLKQIIDAQKWYAALTVNILAGYSHSSFGNLNLMWNNVTGKFEPLLDDIAFGSVLAHEGAGIYKIFSNTYFRPILIDSDMYGEYREILREAVSNENIKDNLAYYDSLTNSILPELYNDQTKARGDFYIKGEIDKLRGYIIDNYERAKFLLTIDEPEVTLDTTENKEVSLQGSFRYLRETILNPIDWAKKHSQFRVLNGDIVLRRGMHIFTENVIIPKETRLIIEAGAEMRFGEGVSLVSYSPVEVRGTKNLPVIIDRLNNNKDWGTFSIINVEQESELRWVIMRGGSSSEKINGVIFTGMLSAHNAPISVSDSQFFDNSGDDSINLKYSTGKITNSAFANSISDALDIDFSTDFIVLGNSFIDIGLGGAEGDAIDLSFSTARIENNTIKRCGDKGVSIGERSEPEVVGNHIEGCLIGVAVKDESVAFLSGNTFVENGEAISLYKKKEVFGGAKAILEGNIFKSNNMNVKIDNLSEVLGAIE